MSASKKIKRELEVAFSKHAQPVWFRILKYIVIVAGVYFFWGNPWFWPVVIVLLILSVCLHLWYRYKTEGWTRSYGAWSYEKNKPRWK